MPPWPHSEGVGSKPCLQKTSEGTERRQQLLRGRAQSPSLPPLAGPPRWQGPGLPAGKCQRQDWNHTALTQGTLSPPTAQVSSDSPTAVLCCQTMALTFVESGHQTPTRGPLPAFSWGGPRVSLKFRTEGTVRLPQLLGALEPVLGLETAWGFQLPSLSCWVS